MRIVSSEKPEFNEMRKSLLTRRERIFESLSTEVDRILQSYRADKEEALVRFNHEFDGVEMKIEELWVDPELIRNAHKGISEEVRHAIEHTIDRIQRFQAELKPSGFQAQEEAGIYWGQEIRPFSRVGIYVPQNYLSSFLLTAVPAQIAKVEEIIIATPPDPKWKPSMVDPALLYAAKHLGIEKILVSGGAGALAALAYGTSQTKAVEKIVGPTGHFGMVAKQRLSSRVSIDGATGPLEVAFVCDQSTSLKAVASDIIGISDRNPDAAIFVFHFQESWLRKLVEELIEQIESIRDVSAREGIRKCLEARTNFFLFPSFDACFDFVNELAPGLVVLPVDSASEYVAKIQKCGGLLVGPYTSPVSLDLYGGATGLVPTLGTASWMAVSSPAAFVRRFSVVELQKEAIERLQGDSLAIAAAEGFSTHENVFKSRIF